MALFKKQEETVLRVEGMHCPKCVARVTTALEGVDGVIKAVVSLEEESAVVTGNVPAESLVDVVNQLGFTASVA